MIRRLVAAACGSVFFSLVYLSGAALVPGPMPLLPLVAGIVAPPLVGALWVLVVTKAAKHDDQVVYAELSRQAILRIATRETAGGKR